MGKDRKNNPLKAIALAAVAVIVALFLIVVDFLKSDLEVSAKSDIAMGTVVSIKLYGGTDSEAAELSKQLAELEKVISWRLDDSAAAELNKNFAVSDSSISELSAVCLDVYNASGGAFDVSVGAVSSLWDIGGDNARVPSASEIQEALKAVDGSLMRVDGGRVEIGKGQVVDFGAVGKGYACDKAYALLEGSLTAKGAVISVGGSIALYGRHNRLGDKWRVAVKNPFSSSEQYAGLLELDGGFVSTSGDYERTLTAGGVTYHHIIDPFTGYPSDSGLSSVTVVADSGVLSDALSTACFVLGYEKSLPLLEQYCAQAVFIDGSRRIYITDGLKDRFTLSGEGFVLADSDYEK